MSLLNRKFLFVHINKSCGGVVTKNFSNNGLVEIVNKHRTLEDMLNIAKKIGVNIDNLFIFTIVRNPWERMLSMYLYYKKGSPEFFSGIDEIDNDFNKWIEFIYSEKFNRERIHSAVNIFKYCFSNQLNWIKDKNGDIIKNTNVFKVEDLNIDDFLKNNLGLSNIDGKSRVHPTKHDHYSKYFSESSKKLVADHYRDDIDYFGYKFENKQDDINR